MIIFFFKNILTKYETRSYFFLSMDFYTSVILKDPRVKFMFNLVPYRRETILNKLLDRGVI